MTNQVPSATPTYVTTAPKLDGTLDDPIWQSCATFTDFRAVGAGAAPSQNTVVRICYDRTTFYIAFECYEDKLDQAVASFKNDNGYVWQDDSVEVYLAPRSVADEAHAHQFVVNIAGAKSYLRSSGIYHNQEWQALVTRQSDRWIAEIKIPFATLGSPGANDSSWRANFCRNEHPHAETSSWSPVQSSFLTYSRFGKLIAPQAEFQFATYRGEPVALKPSPSAPAGLQPVSRKVTSLDAQDYIIPQPQEMINRPGRPPFVLNAYTKIIIDDGATEEDLWAVDELNKTITKLGGKALAVVHSQAAGSTADDAGNAIVIGEAARNKTLGAVSERAFVRVPKAKHADTAYAIDVTSSHVVVSGASVLGTYYGVQTLKQLLKRNSDGSISAGSVGIRDYASMAFRGVHLLTSSDALSYISKLIENVLAPVKINEIVLQTDKIAWKSHPEVTDKANFMPAEDVPKLVEVARRHHIRVTPLVQSPGHLSWAFAGGKNLDFCEDPEHPYCYCMTNPKSYDFIFSIMDEAIELFGHPDYFHAGRDEFDMVGRVPYDDRCRAIGKEKLYIQDTVKVYDHLKSKGCKMMMWGDVLTRSGFSELVDQLPKDILINDWRYAPRETYPTIDFYQAHGFPVVGGTWFNLTNMFEFSRYAAQKGIDGMLQTTWTGWATEKDTLLKYPEQVYSYVVEAGWAWNPNRPEMNRLPYRPAAAFRKFWETKPLDSRTKCQFVRLDQFFNISRADDDAKVGWLGSGRGNDLGAIPAGALSIDGIAYLIPPAVADTPSAIILGGRALSGAFPASVEGIAVGGRATALDFLQGCAYAADRGARVGKYIVHYADGKTVEIPLLYSANTHAWDDQVTGASYGFAWRGTASDGRTVGVCDFRWENLRPDVEIRAIDFVAGDTEASPFLLALTAEQ